MNIKSKIIMKTIAMLCALSAISSTSIPAIAAPTRKSEEKNSNQNSSNSQDSNLSMDLFESEEQKSETPKKNNKLQKQSDNSDFKMLGRKRLKPDFDDESLSNHSDQSSDEQQFQSVQEKPMIPLLKPAKTRLNMDPITKIYNEKCQEINTAIKKANSNFFVDPNEYKELTEKSKELSLEFNLYSNLSEHRRVLKTIYNEQKIWKNNFQSSENVNRNEKIKFAKPIWDDLIKKLKNVNANKEIKKFSKIKEIISNFKYIVKKSKEPKKLSFFRFEAKKNPTMFSAAKDIFDMFDIFKQVTQITDDDVEKIKGSIQKFKDIVVNFKYVTEEFKKTKNEFGHTQEINDGLEKFKNILSILQKIEPPIDNFDPFSQNYSKTTFDDAVKLLNSLVDNDENIRKFEKTTEEIKNIIEKVKQPSTNSETTLNLSDTTVEDLENMMEKMTFIKDMIENVIKIIETKEIFDDVNNRSKNISANILEISKKYIHGCALMPIVIGLLSRPDVPYDKLLNCNNMLSAKENIDPINQLLSNNHDFVKEYLHYGNIDKLGKPVIENINKIKNDPNIISLFIEQIKKDPDLIDKLTKGLTKEVETIRVESAELDKQFLKLYNALLDLKEDPKSTIASEDFLTTMFLSKRTKTVQEFFTQNYSSYFTSQQNQKIKNYNLPEEIAKRSMITEEFNEDDFNEDDFNEEKLDKEDSEDSEDSEDAKCCKCILSDISDDDSISDLSDNMEVEEDI